MTLSAHILKYRLLSSRMLSFLHILATPITIRVEADRSV